MIRSYNAKPIWISNTENMVNQYVDFKKEFYTNTAQSNVKLFISADTQYACFVNQKFISCGQYSAVKEERYYDEIDITEYVKKGRNELLVMAYFQGKSSFSCVSVTPMLIFAVDTGCDSFVSDANTLCRTEVRYDCGEIEQMSSQLLYTFHYDACKTCKNWQPAVEMNISSISLLPRPIQRCHLLPQRNGRMIAQGYFENCGIYDNPAPKMQYAFLQAKETTEIFETALSGPLTIENRISLKKADHGVYIVFDLMKETAGYFAMELTAAKGTVLDIAYGEHLDDLRVRAYPGGRNFAFRYICKQGRQQFVHYLKRIAGRYLQLHISHAEKFEIHNFGLFPCEYPFTEKRGFKGDRLLEKIYRTSVDTLKLCFHEHYEDCPWREQGMYMMDSRLQMLCGYFAFDNTDTQKDAIRIFMKSGDETGRLPLTAPGSEFSLAIPAFILMWITALKEYMEFSGDLQTVGEMIGFAEKIIRFFHSKYDNNAIKMSDDEMWNFYDWSYGLDNARWKERIIPKERYDAPLILYYIMALQNYSVMLKAFGKETEKVKREEELMKKQVNKLFWSEGMEMYKTYSVEKEHFCELVQSLAICTNTVPTATREQLMDKLSKNKCGVPATLSMLFFKYEALLTEKKYYPVVLDDIAEKWGTMLLQGATSFWETEDGGYAFINGGSLCHGWSATPAYFLKKYFLEKKE